MAAKEHQVPYTPPYTLTASILRRIPEICEQIGRLSALAAPLPPELRRSNRIKAIHSSLAIEGNTLSIEQVTAIIAGKRVLGPKRDIKEVHNAHAVYERLTDFEATSEKDFLAAHAAMMRGLEPEAGAYRMGNVAVVKGAKAIHVAPPAARVPQLMRDLFNWLTTADEHPLVTSSVFHYELEFIHPFSDGNGRMGRFWQSVILSAWRPVLAWLPVESVIKMRQLAYYQVIGECDKKGDGTLFVEFMLDALNQELERYSGQQTETTGCAMPADRAQRLREALQAGPLGAADLMRAMGMRHLPTFRKNYLVPALRAGLIERTEPDTPNAPNQKYKLVEE